MFSRKRRFYEKKTFYAAVFTAFSLVMSLSLWMNGDPAQGEQLLSETDPNGRDQAIEQDQQVSSYQVDTNIGQAGITGGKIPSQVLTEGYYVVEEDRYIRIYQVDSRGEKELIRTADILFDLLSTEDQELFRAGIQLETEDQLMELLQDFES